MTCAAPITPAALSASRSRAISPLDFAQLRQRPSHLERERHHRGQLPHRHRPSLHQRSAVPQPRRHRRGRDRGEQREVQWAWTLVAWRRALDASASASSYRSSSASSCANVPTAGSRQSFRGDGPRLSPSPPRLSRAPWRTTRPSLRTAPPPAGPSRAPPRRSPPDPVQTRRAVRRGQRFDLFVSDRATTSATCATSDPSRSLRSPAHRASIATVSSVSRHAKMRRRRFASIAVRASPVTFASTNFAHASATRTHASSTRGLVGTPPVPAPRCGSYL